MSARIDLPTSGDQLGNYRIERALGMGGMGSVFAAHDELLDRPVALKMLHGGGEEDALVGEARALAALDHPNIVRIYGLERIGGRFFVVMERIDGRSVDDVLASERVLAPRAVADVVRAMADALAAVHRIGRVHGDVKPSNILVERRTGRVLLTDFGLSRTLDQHDGRPQARSRAPAGRPKRAGAIPIGLVHGTPEYMAPELARGLSVPRALRPRQDVYSLGATAFDLLTGRPPFDEGSVRTLLRKHAFDEPPRPSQLSPSLPWRVDRAILSSLQKDPEHRTPTPDRFAAELAHAVRRGNAPPRILLADDDGDHRQMVSLALAKRLGRVVVESVSDGERAYRAATERAPDLAVLDLDMPGLNGVELAIALRSTPGLEALPIVVLSACIGPNERSILTRLGVEQCFEKPVFLWRLAAAVRELLHGNASGRSRPALVRRELEKTG